MNTNDPRFDLIQRFRDGSVTEEEHAQVESWLREDAEFRDAWVGYANIDYALSLGVKKSPVQSLPRHQKTVSQWLTWQPVAASIVGILLGTFFTSIVFASVSARVPKLSRKPIALDDPGFENPAQNYQQGFPNGVGVWGGEIDRVTEEEAGFTAKEGQAMLQLTSRGKEGGARVCYIVDLTTLLPESRDRSVEIQVSAAFHTEDEARHNRYSVNLLAYDYEVEEAELLFPDLVEDAVASARQRVDPKPHHSGWQRVVTKLEVPPSARRMIIWLAAREKISTQPKVHRYVDDVKATLITSQF
ncbi:MAG: hypothetical protein P1U58_06050 [Verrucomicrobiales bacterium]|nr:hypothetical protein [Verrucomicrobiales bacterium]